MGKIYYIMGKSSSGKDTLYKKIRELRPDLKPIIMYTTRPMRSGEIDGVDYHFVTVEEFLQLKENGKIIESRTYKVDQGSWNYATVFDENLDLSTNSYIAIGTLVSYQEILGFFGKKSIVPIYIEVDDNTRIHRALEREEKQENPNYMEMCRRFLSDSVDFSETELVLCGIHKKFKNNETIDVCLRNILQEMEDQK